MKGLLSVLCLLSVVALLMVNIPGGKAGPPGKATTEQTAYFNNYLDQTQPLMASVLLEEQQVAYLEVVQSDKPVTVIKTVTTASKAPPIHKQLKYDKEFEKSECITGIRPWREYPTHYANREDNVIKTERGFTHPPSPLLC